MKEILYAKNLKILWASRHRLDDDARESLLNNYKHLTNDIKIHEEEILWPSDKEECIALAKHLVWKYDILAGAWPAQAVEAFKTIGNTIVLSPVSEPVIEPDGSKTRKFKFVRWAQII